MACAKPSRTLRACAGVYCDLTQSFPALMQRMQSPSNRSAGSQPRSMAATRSAFSSPTIACCSPCALVAVTILICPSHRIPARLGKVVPVRLEGALCQIGEVVPALLRRVHQPQVLEHLGRRATHQFVQNVEVVLALAAMRHTRLLEQVRLDVCSTHATRGVVADGDKLAVPARIIVPQRLRASERLEHWPCASRGTWREGGGCPYLDDTRVHVPASRHTSRTRRAQEFKEPLARLRLACARLAAHDDRLRAVIDAEGLDDGSTYAIDMGR
eukprot:scaffold213922_cov28-Tisochrysis_lutea.AAC.5